MLRSLQEITCHPCRYIAKEYFSSYIIGSSSDYVRKNKNHSELIARVDDAYLQARGAKKETFTTTDRVKIDAVRITRPDATKWLLCINPSKAIWQERLEDLLKLSEKTNTNILCVNYRATGASDKKRPTSFDDLVLDVDSGLQKLESEGIQKNNIILYAQSIGCVIALRLATERKMKAVVQNTFALFRLMIKPFSKLLITTLHRGLHGKVERQNGIISKRISKTEIQKEKRTPRIKQRILFSLEDTFLSLPHLIFRVTYFTLSMLDNLIITRNFYLAKKDFIEIGKTIAIDTTLTLTGALSLLTSPFTNRVNNINSKIKSLYLGRSAILTFANSPKFLWIAENILTSSGWIANNAALAKSLSTSDLFIVQAHSDLTVPRELSLGHHVSDSNHTIHRPNEDRAYPDDQHDVVLDPSASPALMEFINR